MDGFYFILYQDNLPSFIRHFSLERTDEHGLYVDDDDCIEINVTENDDPIPIVVAITMVTVSVIVGACGAIWIYLAIKKYLCKSKQSSSLRLQVHPNLGPTFNNTIYVSFPMSKCFKKIIFIFLQYQPPDKEASFINHDYEEPYFTPATEEEQIILQLKRLQVLEVTVGENSLRLECSLKYLYIRLQ